MGGQGGNHHQNVRSTFGAFTRVFRLDDVVRMQRVHHHGPGLEEGRPGNKPSVGHREVGPEHVLEHTVSLVNARLEMLVTAVGPGSLW